MVEHLPFAAKVAANYARRTGHPREDLEQLAAIGLIKASRRYDIHRPGRSPNHFIAYARPFVNGEITLSGDIENWARGDTKTGPPCSQQQPCD